jgi:hypothetical protein
MQVIIPNERVLSSDKTGIHFAAPAIPNLDEARACLDQSDDEDGFYACLTSKALPKEYRLALKCLSETDDPGQAYVCSTGDQRLADAYKRFQEVQDCAGQTNDDAGIAACIGTQFLGRKERYYAQCLASNAGQEAAIAACALAPELTPEQQIALNCAVSTGGEPRAFAVCTAGRLAARELAKCWTGGIGTSDGCFGPNNEIVRFANNVDDVARNAFGPNSVAYQSFSAWQNNIVMPGPNNFFVRNLNNAISDVRGPGPNNDLVKFSNSVSKAFNSVGNQIQCVFGCK